MDKHLEDIRKEMKVLNDELGSLRDRVARIEADIVWIKWLTMGIAGGIIAIVFRVFAQ